MTDLFFDLFEDEIVKTGEYTSGQMKDIKDDLISGDIPIEATFMTFSDFCEIVWEDNFDDEEILTKVKRIFFDIYQCMWDEELDNFEEELNITES